MTKWSNSPLRETRNTKRRAQYRADEAYRQSKITALQARRKRNQEIINTFKLEHGCAKCGYKSHAAALDLHHKHGKLFRVGGSVVSIPKLMVEIAKCEVLCANCHRIHHHEHHGHCR